MALHEWRIQKDGPSWKLLPQVILHSVEKLQDILKYGVNSKRNSW